MNRARLHYATAAFLGEMRRQAVIASSGVQIKSLDDYPPAQRSALMAAVEKAVKAASPEADPAYKAWRERQAKNSDQETQ